MIYFSDNNDNSSTLSNSNSSNDISLYDSNSSNYDINEEYQNIKQNIKENINLFKNLKTQVKEWQKDLTYHINEYLEALDKGCRAQEELLSNFSLYSEISNVQLFQKPISDINLILTNFYNAINKESFKKEEIKKKSEIYLDLFKTIEIKRTSKNKYEKPERISLKREDFIEKEKLIENFKKKVFINKNKNNEEINSNYLCFSPLNDKKYIVLGNKQGEIEIYDFNRPNTNEKNEEKYSLILKFKVSENEVKNMCELGENLLAISERKNVIKIIEFKENMSSYSEKQKIYLDYYDDQYINSMISIPDLSSKNKGHYLCVGSDNNIIIYKSNNDKKDIYFENYKIIELYTPTHCLKEIDNKYLVAACPKEETIKFFDINNNFNEIKNFTDIRVTNGSNVFTLMPNDKILIVACYEGFIFISTKEIKIIKFNKLIGGTVLSLDMFNDNNIICCFSEGRNNIFKQYKINKNDLEIKQISENKDNKNEEIWKLQKINEKIFFIDNINRVNYLN